MLPLVLDLSRHSLRRLGDTQMSGAAYLDDKKPDTLPNAILHVLIALRQIIEEEPEVVLLFVIRC